ncbi:hypothetical protein HOLleu_44426 [Holothuria leucospilota]|uniref:Uncharacterized protein n=1 Tax=Holothuria leucospilota TaxID=206669 RepID=A0A9Q1BAX2_HOLLE|nr:hypothetical protein HOLleu_44426 [Holothuria leucospilota]
MNGWWFGMIDYDHRCGDAILNNLYSIYQEVADCDSIRWTNLPGGDDLIKYTEMKIRPMQG